MRHTFGRALRIALIPAVFALASQPVSAQDYPAREIRSICNFAAGSGADILVRYSGPKLASGDDHPLASRASTRPGSPCSLSFS